MSNVAMIKIKEWKTKNSPLGQILEQCICNVYTHIHTTENFIHIKLSIIYAHGSYKHWFNSTDMGKKYILDLI